jgi:hypothetical protein
MAAVAVAAMRRMFPEPFIAANREIVASREVVFSQLDPGVFAAACRASPRSISGELARIEAT